MGLESYEMIIVKNANYITSCGEQDSRTVVPIVVAVIVVRRDGTVITVASWALCVEELGWIVIAAIAVRLRVVKRMMVVMEMMATMMDGPTHHCRPVRMGDTAKESRGGGELVLQLEECAALLMLLMLLLPLLFFQLEIFLFHRWHFRSGQRSQAITSGFLLAAFTSICLASGGIRFRTSLWRRIGRLDASIAVERTGSVEHVCDGHQFRWGGRIDCCSAGWLRVDGFLVALIDAWRRTGSLHLFTSSRPVLVIRMLLKVDHTQPLRLLYVGSPLLRCQAFPLFP